MVFEIIFLISVSIYFLQLVYYSIGANKKFTKIREEEFPSFTVIVAARNEEDNILDCMKSLEKLNYPEGKLEIILVNDHSTDKTDKIIDEFIIDKPKFKVIIPGAPIEPLKGKTNALAYAIKISKGEVILTTDADCMVNENWVRTIASYYNKDVGFVGGFTTQQDFSAFAGMQAIDFIYLLTVSAATSNLYKPLSCIGNNMSFRKKAYDEVGGYENLPFSITEDFRLLKSIYDLKKYKIVYPVDEGAVVVSKPCPNLKTLYWQKKRWGVGGKENDFVGYFLVASGFLTKLMMVLTPFFFSLPALYLCVFKFSMDYFFVKQVFGKLKLGMKVSHFFAFEIYFIIYVIVLPFVVLPNPTVKWKGRTF